MPKKKVFILDSPALFNNENFSFEPGNLYFTTSEVFAEWRDMRSRMLAENAFSQGLLSIQDPCGISVEKTIAKSSGLSRCLSRADISLIALASEFLARGQGFIVLTDDYAVQNILSRMGAPFRGVAHREIKSRKAGAAGKQG
ncbi:MAG: hypothetical protein HY544_04100 [Candidatus Diapherotrites archaeon]|uniref:Ribonuclease PIN domain-containing protein n=1 Tax=Candidatus Iainarchaeum sp. TaxID=3101447 RepID=A0A8T3YR83_9ARCH|nr:hypothetical protein [Candidatus Diapherotrites archaeon]